MSAMAAQLILLFFGVPILAHPDLSALERRQENLRQTYQNQTRGIEAVSSRLDDLSAEIRDLKTRQKAGARLLRGYRLESLLTEAKTVSDRLDALNRERDQTAAELRRHAALLNQAVDEAIARQRERISDSRLSKQDRRNALLELERLTSRRWQLTMTALENPLPSGARGLVGTPADRQDLAARLDAVRDFIRRLGAEEASIQAELAETRRQNFVRNELTHLLEEESFFGEQGFVRSASRAPRSDAATLARANALKAGEKAPAEAVDATGPVTDPAATTDPAAAAVPPATAPEPAPMAGAVPPPGPPVPGAPAPLTALTAPVDPIGAPDAAAPPATLLPPTVDRSERDPMIQLAGEFGLPSKEIEELNTLLASGKAEDRVRWLERRLAATRKILDRLSGFERSLEGSLNKSFNRAP
jgi:hypothetical protein